MGEDLNLTFERLYEILRLEKERAELQALPSTFFVDVVTYLTVKKASLSNLSLTEDERERISVQLKNVRKIITTLYERRQKKILTLAIDQVITHGRLTELSSLLPEEQTFFSEAVLLLERNHRDILSRLLGSSTFSESNHYAPHSLDPSTEKSLTQDNEISPSSYTPSDGPKTKVIRFLEAVPKFLGTELEEYGPFEEDETTVLPSELADILITKHTAQEVRGD